MARKVFRAIADLCTGCRRCELVCSLSKSGTINPELARVRVTRSSKDGTCTPVICRMCKVPLCKLACAIPEAMTVDDRTGAVAIDAAKCIGCRACMAACPFDAIWLGPNDEVLKCDLCGGDPTCVKYCPPRPDHQCTSLPYPRASALEYVEPHRITRKQPPASRQA